MKKTVRTIITSLLLSALFFGCSAKDVQSAISTDGSTSMEKVIGYLSESYMEENPGAKVTYNPTGSGSGIRAVMDGSCDIGLSSRDLKPEEAAELDATIVAIDAIAVIVNPENGISDLTISEIADIYTGKITNWSELGGENLPIVAIGREAASGTRDGFESVTGTEDSCKYAQELTSTGDVVQSVASNPNAIGYASIASVKGTVKAISVDGIVPSAETVQNGSYKLQRNFIFVTKRGKKLNSAADAFFKFATSESAEELIIKAGAIPAAK